MSVPSVWYPTESLATVTTTASTDDDVELRFYTENYKIDAEMKKRLCKLVQYPEFRDFETYLDWRINASAHRMKSLLMIRNDDEAANEAAAIDSLSRIPQDMQNFWTEVKLMDAERDILVKEGASKKPKIFGDDAVTLDMQ